MSKTVAALSCAAFLVAFAPAAFADEPTTMLGGTADAGLDSGANIEVPSVMHDAADGDTLLGGAEATVVSAGDLGATTMDEKVSLPSPLDAGPSSGFNAYSLGASSGANADSFSVSGGSPTEASFGGWSVASSSF